MPNWVINIVIAFVICAWIWKAGLQSDIFLLMIPNVRFDNPGFAKGDWK